ncbi:lipase family protein [Aestuariivirga sp.]|uniref:lipase family protein n=1 Tax=Aestuariivirga sp. TaxID=2650926 RepID=UPI003BAA295C
MAMAPARIPFRSLLAGVVIAVVGALPSPAHAAGDDAFYLPPSPLASAEHGAVIRSEALTGSASLPSAARNLLVLYHSRNLDGQDIAVSGTIAIPQGEPPGGGWPMTSWAHGTTGIGPGCAPSRDTPSGPEHAFLGPKQKLMDDYVRRGFVVVATDYEGLGAPGLHPFLQGVPAGRGVIDIMRAAREIDPGIGASYVIIGHSQGGHADLFAASIGPDYAPELKLLGDVAMAPASHIEATVEGMAAATKPSYALGYAMYVLQSYASNHPGIDLTNILTPEALAHLPETREACITRTVSTGYWATAIPKDQFIPGASLAPVLAVAAANDPGKLKIAGPTLIVQGTADDTVLPAWTDAVVRALCSRGNSLDYTVYPGATHETIVSQSMEQVRAFVDARFRNAPAPGNCNSLPSAADSAN